MQRVLSSDYWAEVRKWARRASWRKAAIAYVTRDLVGFKKGDVLVVNASDGCIANGDTSADLLHRLLQKETALYHCPDLHAKVLLFGRVAVIGSANMSASSVHGLVEAGLITDNSSVVSGVASLIEQLRQQSRPLTRPDIDRLRKIRVIRRGGHGRRKRLEHRPNIQPLGNRTWIVGVRELANDPPADEQRLIDKASEELELREEQLEWIKWPNRGQFVQLCREGDQLIEIWRSSKAKKPSIVYRAAPVLLKQRTKRWTRFYLRPRTGRYGEMPFGRFKRLLKRLGYPKKIGPMVAQSVDPEVADAITRNWQHASRA